MRELRGGARELLAQLKREGEVVLTSNGKPVAIVAGVVEDHLEQQLSAYRRARAAIAVEEMQEAAVAAGVDRMTPEDIDREVDAARRERRG
ncbi:MAG TPA: type II toxin-antitoxin system Phd/YefM family antitoxin [bacterium]